MGYTILIIYVLICGACASRGMVSREIDTLQKEFWHWRMSVLSTYSTYQGFYDFNDLMTSFDYDDFEQYRTDATGFLDRLHQIDLQSLSKADQVNYAVLQDSLETYLNGSKWAYYGSLNPISFLGGIHLYSGPSMAKTATRGDFENYITRLHAVQKQVDEIKKSFRKAIQLGRTLHNVSITKVPGQLAEMIEQEPANTTLYKPFMDKLDDSHIPEGKRETIRTRGVRAVQAYIEAMRDLKKFIEEEYLSHTRTDYGVYAWDPTGDYYRACLKWHLSFEMSPEDVHQKGLEEVARIHGEMLQIMQRQNHRGTVRQFFDSLKNDSRFFSDDKDRILKAYNDTVFKRINPKLPEYFRDIPSVPLEVRASDFDGLGGGYSQASEDEPGGFVVNLFRPKDVPFFEMMALSLHESNPGHHLQHSYAIKAKLPDFRAIAVLYFYSPPNYFPFYSAYQEGWGLYSEFLGEEMGMYKDDYEMMGRYSYEILRAVRMVVDTGLHYYKWSRDEALEYMTNYTAFARGSAANEIDRYITWPGQACAYKIGEMKIKDLRRIAEEQLGSKFDIRDFHFVVLQNGGMPLSVLESLVMDWIRDTQATSGTPSVISSWALLSCILLVVWASAL